MPKTKEEIINETVKYYGEDASRRAFVNESMTGCSYLTEDGRRCAVGRCLKEDLAPGVTSSGKFAEDFIDKFGQEVFKPEYKGHEGEFWQDLQKLHDDKDYFDENGITLRGQQYADYLLDKYSNA